MAFLHPAFLGRCPLRLTWVSGTWCSRRAPPGMNSRCLWPGHGHVATLVFLAGLVAVPNETGVLSVSSEQRTCGQTRNLMLMPPERAFYKPCKRVSMFFQAGVEPRLSVAAPSLSCGCGCWCDCPGEGPLIPASETRTLVPDGSWYASKGAVTALGLATWGAGRQARRPHSCEGKGVDVRSGRAAEPATFARRAEATGGPRRGLELGARAGGLSWRGVPSTRGGRGGGPTGR